MTLPEDAIRALAAVDRDNGWAVVKLLQLQGRTDGAAKRPQGYRARRRLHTQHLRCDDRRQRT